jgi:dienelactone hydrolase
MLSTIIRIIVFYLCLVVYLGCAHERIPCHPPSHYTPEPGAPYIAEEVQIITNEGYLLAGTLTIPVIESPPFPAVILITASGHSDRDHVGNNKYPINQYRPFRQIADALSRRGIVVLRMDDRGVGCSKGGVLADATIIERSDDTRAGLEYLIKRKEIDAQRLGLLGLSEGANIAPIVAASDSSIRAIVMMAAIARSGWEIEEYQYRYEIEREEGLTEEEHEQKVLEKKKRLKEAVSKGDANRHDEFYLNQYIPLQIAKKVKCSVLILHGDKDAHIPSEDAQIFANAIRLNGNKDVTFKIMKNHNHLFLEDSDGRKSRYFDFLKSTNKLSEKLLALISDWFSIRLNPK